MSEDSKNDAKKTRVNIIRKAQKPAAAQKSQPQPTAPTQPHQETEKKVIVLKKKQPVIVKVKKEEEPQPVAKPVVQPVPESQVAWPPKADGQKVVRKPQGLPAIEPKPVRTQPQQKAPAKSAQSAPAKSAPEKKPVAKDNVIAGKSYMVNNVTHLQNSRIQSPLHNGPVIIKSSDLPPLPGQKTEADKNAPQRPRVAGVVGGRQTGENRNQGTGRGRYQNQQGGRNAQGHTGTFNRQRNDRNQTGQLPRAGQSYTPQGDNRQGGFRRPAGSATGYRPGMKTDASQAPASDINQKGPGKRPQSATRKKDYNDRYQKDEELDFQLQKKKREDLKLSSVPKTIDIMESITVADLAKKMNLKASDIISKLFKMGLMVTINQQIDHETAEIIASEYNCSVHLVSLYDETIIEQEEDREEDREPRAPIVTIMGHVDHGKTKLLDAIRSSNVAEGEFGGITQHIGAYKVSVPDRGDIVFLDTPGHAAFSMMRARGAQVTDIVVLVVAANDGVMPQTKEAIDHAKAAKVPIIVAINKCDLADANPERVMQQLSELGLMPEEWGGQTLFCQISALKKIGIDDLLDTILLQAEMLELRANRNCRAVGKVLESRIDPGRGTVATVIVEKGTLRQGDYFVAGIYPGRVRAMFDDKGKKIKIAYPSDPVEIIGLSDIPSAGDPFQVTEDEKQARMVGAKRQELERIGEAGGRNKITLENLNEKIKEGQVTDFNVLIKGDVQGSVEALQGVLEKLSTSEIKLNVLRASAGAIIESDISLASASDAIVIGFNVRPTPRALALAEQEKVEIKKYNVIYDVVDDIKAAMEGMLAPDIREVDIGTVEVREIYKVPKVGLVAGCYVTDGKVKRSGLVRIIRDSIQLNKDPVRISSLKRFKDDVKEVAFGYECGIGLEDWQDLQIGDIFEVLETEEVRRTLQVE